MATTRKIEINYSASADLFYCECGGEMQIERISRRLLVLRCTSCQHAVDGRLVDFAAARNARSEFEQAVADYSAKWAAIAQDLETLRAETYPRRSWLATLLAR